MRAEAFVTEIRRLRLGLEKHETALRFLMKSKANIQSRTEQKEIAELSRPDAAIRAIVHDELTRVFGVNLFRGGAPGVRGGARRFELKDLVAVKAQPRKRRK